MACQSSPPPPPPPPRQPPPGLPGAVMGSEDCLHLAVHTPQLPSTSHKPRLPVMVYIHGGTFVSGGYMGAGPKTFNTFCT